MNEYKAALAEWHRAIDAFNLMGEPQAGPILDRLNAARERFIRAQTPEPPADNEDRSAS